MKVLMFDLGSHGDLPSYCGLQKHATLRELLSASMADSSSRGNSSPGRVTIKIRSCECFGECFP